MGFTVTAQQAEEANSGFPELPAGIYKVQCTTNSKEDVSTAGKDMLVLELEVISDDKGDVSHRGKKVWHRIMDGEYMVSFLTQALTGFGIPITGSLTATPETFIHKTATVEVVKNGDYTNVKKFLPNVATETPTFTEEDPF